MKSQIISAYMPKRGCQADLAFRFGVSRQYVHEVLREAGIDTRLPKRQKPSPSYRKPRTEEERRVRRLLKGAQSRAKKLGRSFSLRDKDIKIPAVCPVLGIPLFSSAGHWTDNSPTIDRVHNNLGYEPGNVVVISHRANRLKGIASIDELRKLADFYS